MSEYVYATDEHKGHWLTGEEIVRCKDCKYYMPTMYTPFSNEALCYGLQMEEDCGMVIVKPDGFCAWGIRKDVNNASD